MDWIGGQQDETQNILDSNNHNRRRLFPVTAVRAEYSDAMKIRVRKADVIFSKLVRTRSNWTCDCCGVNKQDDPGTLDCAHIMSRRSVALRWHPDNAISLCRKDHMFFTEHPFDWRDFCVERFGEDRVAELRLVSNKPVKWSKAVREDIYTHMKNQLKERTFERYEVMHEFT